MLGPEEGSTDIDGVDEGNILALKDGSIDAEGNVLGSGVGVRLKLGPMLGVDAGSTEIDGFVEGVLDGSTLCVRTSLGFSFGDTDCVGIILGSRDGPIDSDGISL
eukprot:scaffold334594_cov37-Attheya_sp.AAC.1